MQRWLRESRSGTGRLRTAWGQAILVATIVVVAGCTAPDSVDAPAISDRAEILDREDIAPMGTFTVEDTVVAGPAPVDSARSLGNPNRVGSVEVPVRVYTPVTSQPSSSTEPLRSNNSAPWATIVWCHGGSFVHGNLDWPETDWIARRFAEAGVQVYAVDYVLASDKVKAPAPSNDVMAVLDWVTATADGPVAIGGASAGAHLAVTATVTVARANETEPPAAMLLLYPTLHRVQPLNPKIAALTADLPAQRQFSEARILDMYDFYLGSGFDADPDNSGRTGAGDGAAENVGDDEFASESFVVGELPQHELAHLPPTVIVNAEADDLRASGEEFARQLQDASVPVVSSFIPGTVHGFMNRPNESTQSELDARQTADLFMTELRNTVTS